jgi:hypothetical protein
MQRKQLIAVCLLLTCVGCGDTDSARLNRPDTKDIQSSLRMGEAGEILVAAHYSGGAAGDKTYKVLACAARASACEIIATVDPYDSAVPTLARDKDAVNLTVNQRDGVSGFRNFSHDLQTGRGSLVLRYR